MISFSVLVTVESSHALPETQPVHVHSKIVSDPQLGAVCWKRQPGKNLPSTGITQLPRYYEPRRHPIAPRLSLTGFRLVIPAPRQGVPRVACVFFVYMLSPLPRRSDWAYHFALLPSHISLPRNGDRVGLRNDLFEACSVFTRVTACTLAGSPKVIRYIEGFSHFVTSVAAAIASGWSELPGGALTH